MMIIINTVNKIVEECKHFICKVQIEMHAGGRAAWQRGLELLLNPPATLTSDRGTAR